MVFFQTQIDHICVQFRKKWRISFQTCRNFAKCSFLLFMWMFCDHLTITRFVESAKINKREKIFEVLNIITTVLPIWYTYIADNKKVRIYAFYVLDKKFFYKLLISTNWTSSLFVVMYFFSLRVWISPNHMTFTCLVDLFSAFFCPMLAHVVYGWANILYVEYRLLVIVMMNAKFMYINKYWWFIFYIWRITKEMDKKG